MTDWAALRDAYGSAEAVPRLLTTAAHETAWESPVWEELWSRLYHQGSVYPASRAAVPVLTKMAQARRDVAVDPAIFLTAAILSTTDEAGSGSIDPRLVDLATHKLSLVHEGMLSTEFPDDSDGMPVTPATQADIGSDAGRLLALARDHGHPAVVTELLTLFGHVTCPVCGASLRVSE